MIANHYKKREYDFRIVTSAKNMVNTLYKSKEWIMVRYERTDPKRMKGMMPALKRSARTNCKTASFKYIGDINGK